MTVRVAQRKGSYVLYILVLIKYYIKYYDTVTVRRIVYTTKVLLFIPDIYNYDPPVIQALYSVLGRCTQFEMFNCPKVVGISIFSAIVYRP